MDPSSLVNNACRHSTPVQCAQTLSGNSLDETIPALILAQASCTPGRIAIEFGDQAITYHALVQRAGVVAAELQRLGVGAGTLVGVYAERSIDMVIAMLGVLISGGAYVPLDPAFPKERLAFMVEDSNVRVIITEWPLATQLPEHDAHLVSVAELPESDWIPTVPLAAGGMAYVLFTSGSTGRPNGVQITHRALANCLKSMRHTPGFAEDDILLAVTTFSFDIAALELFLPLICGGKVIIVSRDVTADGEQLAREIALRGITVMQATPITWHLLLATGWTGKADLKILCGGEAFPPSLARKLIPRCAELWNMYGPTETTIWSTCGRIVDAEEPIHIGRPIDNTVVHIVASDMQPVATGEPGELFIGGMGLARGYLKRPELTARRFVPDSVGNFPEAQLFKTGDLALRLPDGTIQFLGRLDHQIKLRGIRIELDEIEEALADLQGMAQAVVVGREDEYGDKRLVAYVVPKTWPPGALLCGGLSDGSLVTAARGPYRDKASAKVSASQASSLRAALRITLPEYMIPSAFVFLEALPLTPNGKTDRSALPPPDESSDPVKTDDAPCGAIEVRLAGIIGSLLRVPHVGRNDSFFDLGGHSILAAKLFNEIDRGFGKRLPLATLLRNPTIESLAAILGTECDRSQEWKSLVPIQPQGSQPRFFCVHGAGGNVLLYRDLARRLGTDYPFYGIQSQGMDGKEPLLTTIEEMAEKYLGEIRELQPDGPYCLGGYCLGGTIAYEIAQLLRRDGYEVALVALFDTYNFSLAEQRGRLAYLRQKVMFHLSNLVHQRLGNWPDYFSNKLRVAKDGELFSLLKVLGWHSREKPAGPSLPPIEASVQEMNDAAAAVYRPKPYSGRVTVFKPKVNYDCFPDPQLGWGALVTGRLEIVELPVNPHAMLVEPYVQVLSERLKKAMKDQLVRPQSTAAE